MNVFSMVKVTRLLSKIYIPIIALLVFCTPFLGITYQAFANTSNITNYIVGDASDTASPNQQGIFVSMPDGSEVAWTVSTDFGGVFAYDYFLIYYRPDVKETYLGDLTLDIESIVAAYPYIYLQLPVAAIDSSGNLYYTNTYESVTVIAGQPYYNSNEDENNYDYDYFLFNNYNKRAFSGGGTSAVENRTGNPSSSFVGLQFSFSNYVAPNGLIFTGSYHNVWNDNPYNYMCYIFQTLKYMRSNRMNVSYRITKIYADGFAHLDTDEYKLYKQTVENTINGALSGTNDKLDDLLNEGSGQFDDTKQEIDDASDRADVGNQEIADNAPKPDIDDTYDDVTGTLDEILTDGSAYTNRILSAIIGNNIISTMILISVSAGAVKYIFFGKG